ncbi:MAG: lysine--tRNA ligase [Candidatus Lambdaproteobacteria bacterium RIFOXYD1_FULL_56_27]|uniref:Lysine--tRNA ligase n=1 Tax=Candidatus Lambdaproteobacteria bacterium RIFOXYD2_FULL_56_26 TaxID=1817773 RepID=A0A1F6GNW1_9PROT|nr:MAG: lysine--tRNA ligase [Candidatus Lambdaproteobacteria bacterium RIFOXYD2_FULL_56_26]OGH03879.1 MAG: lysine--tRNA ligase [Candidatus Lambdaproteobacteria bacterium RIFOXYC1_FULL_56_13]OGH08925.1 MAG: lysine--tRNA ligase [Candidatus Lambdaproteobacteria bacterium RIFOXYD1_FULL_56_27]
MAAVNWPREEALKILSQHPNNDRPILFETGFGPSGLPHIGTFAEVVRTLFVLQALKAEAPDREAKLFVFCDDLDGLRSLPENVPNHELLRPHLGKPLSAIPDPFGTADSFSGHMNGKLREFLDQYGFAYEYKSSTQAYRSGAFDQGLKAVMDRYDKVRELFVSTIGEDKREAWSPFFPICQSCGKVYTTRVLSVDPGNYTLDYACDKDEAAYKSCGHQGQMSVLGGNAKVGWKVDWALRWFVFGVDYEMYGKDLMESASLSGKICRALGGKPPVPYKYELFLDESGAKISKKIGNGISMGQWIKYAPLGALLHFLLGNPNKAKKMGLPILPKLVDEYLQSARTETAGELFSAPWFLSQIQHQPLQDTPELASDLTYSLLFNLSEALSIFEAPLLYDYALKYDPKVGEQSEFYLDLCQRICRLALDQKEVAQEPEPLSLDLTFLPQLQKLALHLESLGDQVTDGEELQTYLFGLAKELDLNPRDWFAFLYGALLGKAQGPKIGPFFAIMGPKRALAMVTQALERIGG